MGSCIVLVRLGVVNWCDLDVALASVGGTKNTVVLLPQSILLGTIGGVYHEVASTLTEVWTVLTASLEEADGGVVRSIVSDGLRLPFSIRNVVVRSYGRCILTTVFRIIFNVSVEIH